MSKYVTTDYVVMAIVEGMYHHKMITFRDRYFTAGALRKINEHITWEEWREDGCLPLDMDIIEDIISKSPEAFSAHEMKPWEIENLAWELVKDANHKQVNWHLLRDFTDVETWLACKCWLAQVDTDKAVSFDYTTIIASVKLLKDEIEREHVEDKSWKRRCFFGNWKVFCKNDEGDWEDIEKTHEMNIAA